MNLTRARVRNIGWAVILTICAALTLALTFRVNAVKSQVRLTERKIVSLKQEKLFLETEFETRANQQQLRSLNEVEFGYTAPTAEQYIEGERELAALGKPSGPGAPQPIRVAVTTGEAPDTGAVSTVVAMVSPLTGESLNGTKLAAVLPGDEGRRPTDAASLRDRLARIERRGAMAE